VTTVGTLHSVALDTALSAGGDIVWIDAQSHVTTHAFAQVAPPERALDRVKIEPEVNNEAPYNPGYYREEAIRATTSVLGPLGWTEGKIIDALDGQHDLEVDEFRTETHHRCK
jgi:hypothetical protein